MYWWFLSQLQYIHHSMAMHMEDRYMTHVFMYYVFIYVIGCKSVVVAETSPIKP